MVNFHENMISSLEWRHKIDGQLNSATESMKSYRCVLDEGIKNNLKCDKVVSGLYFCTPTDLETSVNVGGVMLPHSM